MRPVLDTIRRGFDNVLANWPLLLIRIGESVAVVIVLVAGLLASIVPYLVSGVFTDFTTVSTPEEVFRALVLDHPFAILIWFVGFSATLIVAILLHSFVHAGIIGVYLDGERAAGAAPVAPRSRFEQFSPDRWLAHSRRGMWPLFWIYNIIWGVASLVLLFPILGAFAFIFLARDSPESMIAISCASVVFLLIAVIVVSMIAYLWSQLAIIAAMRDSFGAVESIRRGLGLFRERFASVVLVSVILFVISMAVGGVFSGVYFGFGLASAVDAVAIVTLPAQIALSLVQSMVSVFTSSWLLASLISAVQD
ncbi:MAG TPA: hypothetical protein VIL97_03385 [Thermoanaerobaculia bacterium]